MVRHKPKQLREKLVRGAFIQIIHLESTPSQPKRTAAGSFDAHVHPGETSQISITKGIKGTKSKNNQKRANLEQMNN